MNLMEGLLNEIERNIELCGAYKEIPTGVWAAGMIQKDIDAGKKAVADNDVVAMLSAHKALENNKG